MSREPEQMQEMSDDETFGLSADVVTAVEDALDAVEDSGNEETLQEVGDLVENLHEADAADLLEQLGRKERKALMKVLGAGFDPEILPYLDTSVKEEIVELLGPQGIANLLPSLDSDDQVDLFDDLDEELRMHILSALPMTYRRVIEEGLSYPESSAGRLMQRELVAVPSVWTVGETIDYMRVSDDLPDDFYDIYIVTPRHKAVGSVSLSKLLRSRRHMRLDEIIEEQLHTIPLVTDQEEVAHLFRQYSLVSAPVVDEQERLVGVITIDDVVDVIDEEAAEDIMKMGGVSEQDFYEDIVDTTKSRFAWLVVNLFTAIAASLVIGLFEGTIEQVVALAVLMPIVASMGGNAGTQTLTVAVRSLAMKDLSSSNAHRFVGKELLIGVINGLLFAILAATVAWVWFESRQLAFIIAAAMIINMIVAGLSGTLIPIGLDRLKIDPAIASSVFLTTVTDVIGFFAFLGLAAFFLL
ncbi:magnesium transporter [Kiloniella sp. b19]|uniref:magnesium transporter n=1 Tax=Kiloniella sp. GXU_MW_B19 TaxID=3141326 RepID=UPI0031D93D71